MKRKNKILAASAAFCLSLGLSLVSVGCGGGSFAMTEFVVNTATVSLEYEVGDTVDFSTLEMFATFSDDSKKDVELSDVKIFLNGENISATLDKITETAGTKTVSIVYESGHGTAEKSLTIKVKEETVVVPEPVLPVVTGFEQPQFLSSYKADVASATNDPNADGFEGLYFQATETEYYKVGDDNAFRFVPVLTCMDMENGGAPQTLQNFTANTSAWVLVDGTYQALEKRTTADNTNVYQYYLGDTRYFTENAVKNEYTFAENAEGNVLKISVLPDANAYTIAGVTAIEMEFEVVDGFNLYEAKELCVLDNSDRGFWDSIKGELGLLNVDPNAIILHQDTVMTAEAVPAVLKYTLSDSYKVSYKDANNKTGKPEDFGLTRTFLWDSYEGEVYALFDHTISAGEQFTIYGNYFELDASKLPLVAAFEAEVSGGNGSTWYNTDFSNTTLLHIKGQESTVGDGDENFAFYNLAVRGNAKPDQLVIDTANTTGQKGDTLVYGGGIIFTKVKNTKATFENVRTYTFFIPFFADPSSVVTYNYTKCYDSFQNAVFTWGKADINVKNSYFRRAGGPLIIMTHPDPDTDTTGAHIPNVTIDDNSVLEAYLSGTETWFKVVKAEGVIEPIMGLDAVFNQMGMTFKKDGKMNLIALMMRDSTDAVEAVKDITVQGKFTYKTAYVDRMNDSPFGQAVKQVLPTGAPVFNLGSSAMAYFNGTTLIPVLGELTAFAKPQQTDENTTPQEKFLTLSQGGISIVLGYYELNTAA
ncbi:MAG: hypothetical protein IJX87_05010 [Clostridia bacterium]|nr:hypothetical protein [Clostridia bacterium]